MCVLDGLIYVEMLCFMIAKNFKTRSISPIEMNNEYWMPCHNYITPNHTHTTPHRSVSDHTNMTNAQRFFGFDICWYGIWNMMPFHLIVDKFSFYFFISPHWVTHPSYVIMANKRKMKNIVFSFLLEWMNTKNGDTLLKRTEFGL